MSRPIAIIVAVFAILFAGWFFFMGGGDTDASLPETPAAETTTTGN